jgi:hypothetical protein
MGLRSWWLNPPTSFPFTGTILECVLYCLLRCTQQDQSPVSKDVTYSLAHTRPASFCSLSHFPICSQCFLESSPKETASTWGNPKWRHHPVGHQSKYNACLQGSSKLASPSLPILHRPGGKVCQKNLNPQDEEKMAFSLKATNNVILVLWPK